MIARLGARTATGLPERIEALNEAVELAHGRADEEDVAFGRHVVAKAGERLRHGTTHTLAALLGATGSGKSSITNAVVGSDIATTGVRRPTTSSSLACFWGDDDAQPLLDWLEIRNRHHVVSASRHDDADTDATDPAGTDSTLAGLVLLDVPDHDSVAVEHRLEMERIAEHADLLLWVTDHEKYGDKAMHEYLRRLSGHGAVTAMILNKADQLSPADLDACQGDLRRLLADDGLTDVDVVPISATTGSGVDRLLGLLAAAVDRQQAVVERLGADARLAADALSDGLATDNADRHNKAIDRAASTLAAELVGASGLATVTDAVTNGHRRDAASMTGWPFSRWVRRLRPHPLRKLHLGQGSAGRATLPQASGVQRARSENAVRQATAAVTDDLPDPWPELVRDAATPDQQVLDDRLDRAIADSVRANHNRRPRWWAAVNGLQWAIAAATVTGVVWLGLLAFAAYLQIPEPPTPSWRNIPVPTGLLIGGIALGLVVAFVSARFAALGARRRSRAVRIGAESAVADVADELVMEPIRAELDRRSQLHELLETAAGKT